MDIKLYEVADQYQALLNNLYDEETGVVDETALNKLNEINDTLENKCINITKYFKTLEMSAEAIERERKAMQAREQSIKKKISAMKEYLRYNMDRCKIKKIECPHFVLSLQNNPPAVEVIDENEIPHLYDKPVEREIDISRIKKDLADGIDVPGARLVQRNSLRIR